MAELKTKQNNLSVAEFIKGVEDPVVRKNCEALKKLMSRLTGKRAKMWGTSIVGFGKYAYNYNSGHSGEFFVTGFSPRKQNLTIYIMPGFKKYDAQLKKIGKHKLGKSCLYVKNLDQVDMEALESMIRDSIKRMTEMYESDVTVSS